MDIRTYDADSDVDAQQMTHFDVYAELNAHMTLLQQAEAEVARLRDNAAELGKALDMALAERDGAFAELDAHRSELAALRDERTRLLAVNARLADAETHARLASDLLQGATEDLARERQQRRELERQLDAMREAHSVIVGRMEAMGC